MVNSTIVMIISMLVNLLISNIPRPLLCLVIAIIRIFLSFGFQPGPGLSWSKGHILPPSHYNSTSTLKGKGLAAIGPNRNNVAEFCSIERTLTLTEASTSEKW